MFKVYILYSESIQKFYCGQTNDVKRRLIRHNTRETKSNKHGVPWSLIGYLVFETRSEAMSMEKAIKNRGIKRWLEQNQTLLIQFR